jgi:hypothetical protein
MALVALALVAFPSLRFVYLWVAGYEVYRVPLVALGPLGVAVVGWIGARLGRPGLTWWSAILLTVYVVALTRMVWGILPFVYVPGAAAMFMAAALVRDRKAAPTVR